MMIIDLSKATDEQLNKALGRCIKCGGDPLFLLPSPCRCKDRCKYCYELGCPDPWHEWAMNDFIGE